MRNASPTTFYQQLTHMIQRQIVSVFEKHRGILSGVLTEFLEKTTLTDHFSMVKFFEDFENLLNNVSLKINL